MGPLTAGEVVSCSLFIRTTHSGEMVLVSYSPAWGGVGSKDMFLLTLKAGVPILYTNENTFLTPSSPHNLLDDGNWHHILVRMPSKSCLLSEMEMYLNGEKMVIEITGADDYTFFKSTGYLSLGGWGYSHEQYGVSTFPSVGNYIGAMDDVRMWIGRPIDNVDMAEAAQKNFDVYDDKRCRWNHAVHSRLRIGPQTKEDCIALCNGNASCWGYEIKPSKGTSVLYDCFHFTERPVPKHSRIVTEAQCAVAV